MWSLKPYNSPPSICPGCNHENDGFASYSFIGSQIMSTGTCQECGSSYHYNWSVGHGEDFPFSFNNGLSRYSEKAEKWLAKPIIQAVNERLHADAEIRREIRTEVSQAMVLNCLDSCYGHIVLKVLNTWFYSDLVFPKGVVVIVPANCAWMVPKFVSEVWAVDIQLADINSQLDSIKVFIDEVSENFESLNLLPVQTHPNHQHIDFSQYFGVTSFRLEKFNSLPPQVCFIWREDRWWIRTRAEEMLSFIAIKYTNKRISRWLMWRQLKAIIKVARLLRREVPDLSIKVVGLGVWGKFPSFIEDLRKIGPNLQDEISWCEEYAKSHLVVGVHGSSMMIPTALSAGFIELIPTHKIPHISEDILMKHTPRFQTFLGRHLDVFTSPRTVVKHIISILMDFSYLYKNTTAGR